jgi:hypothetical protein
MKNMSRKLLLLTLVLLLVACKRDTPLLTPDANNSQAWPKLELALVGKTDSADFVMKQWFTLPDGSKMRIDELKLYLGEIQFQNTAGIWIVAKPYQLFDFLKSHSPAKTLHGKGERVQLSLPPGTYHGIRFGLGLPEWTNKLDPTQFPASHDLSVYQGMYWDWNSGYRFFLMEGMQDTSSAGNGIQTIPFAYHLGTDSLYEELEFEFDEITLQPNPTGTTLPALDLELDIHKIFYNVSDTIRPVTDPVTHTSGNFPLAIRVQHNFGHAWKVIRE